MSTFSDLLLLMLTFFVLLLTMSTMDQEKLEKVTKNKKNAFQLDTQRKRGTSIFKSKTGSGNIERNIKVLREKLSHLSTQNKADERKLETLLTEIFESTDMRGRAWIDFRPKGIEINLDGHLAFKGKTDKLTPDAKRLLRHFAAIIGPEPFNVIMESYLGGAETFKENERNWDLALQRADAAINYMFEYGVDSKKARIMGYGHKPNEGQKHMQYGSLLKLHVLVGPNTAEPQPR